MCGVWYMGSHNKPPKPPKKAVKKKHIRKDPQGNVWIGSMRFTTGAWISIGIMISVVGVVIYGLLTEGVVK